MHLSTMSRECVSDQKDVLSLILVNTQKHSITCNLKKPDAVILLC